MMAQFLIFVGALMVFGIAALVIANIANRMYISMRRRESVFDIEKETHEKIKKRIKEDKEDER